MSDYATLIRRIEALTEACYALEREIYTRFHRELTECAVLDLHHPPQEEPDFDDPIPF